MISKLKLLFILLLLMMLVIGCTEHVEPPIICQSNEELIDGSCIIIPVQCGENETLEDGICVTLPPQCGENEYLENGVCVLPELNLFEKTYTLQQVTADFNQLVRYLEDHNPMLYSFEKDIRFVVDEQRNLLFDGMNQVELIRVLAPIVSAYQCGHTFVGFSRDSYAYFEENIPIFPLFVRLFEHKLYVTGNYESYGIPLGSEIISMNGEPMECILETYLNAISSDGENLTFKYAIIDMIFSDLYFEFISSSTTFLIEYIEPGTSVILTKTLIGVTKNILYSQITTEDQLPYQAFYTEQYALMEISTFQPISPYSRMSYSAFFLEFFTEVEQRGIQNVIIDIRNNGGGDPMVSSDLFSFIADYAQPYFDMSSPDFYPTLKRNVPLKNPHFSGNLYVLINGMSFSTSGHFAALVKSQNLATFIGEESGGSYTCSDNSSQTSLSNTRLFLGSSNSIWTVAVDGLELGRGITPDYQVLMTIDDYIQQTDPILDFTLQLIQNG
ncbi:MAG: hypothetical protein A2009_04135 [Tenericutes bacterium GWD2_38_27]|nr:MAG: hypothetical protein A2009_04135 [Tenericutes bacterium GWD2_38_27]HBG32269.1 hypothetical protein [Acholeplasmataceae bacterium]HCB65979.1 hypothetical protein [Acholeplasmataceae bacterium]